MYVVESGGPRRVHMYQARIGMHKEQVYGGSESPIVNGGKIDTRTT